MLLPSLCGQARKPPSGSVCHSAGQRQDPILKLGGSGHKGFLYMISLVQVVVHLYTHKPRTTMQNIHWGILVVGTLAVATEVFQLSASLKRFYNKLLGTSVVAHFRG